LDLGLVPESLAVSTTSILTPTKWKNIPTIQMKTEDLPESIERSNLSMIPQIYPDLDTFHLQQFLI
jgi:hypothetical protein